MLISSGKDCYMKFWHLLPDSKGSGKGMEKEKESKDEGRMEWMGESEDSDREDTKAPKPPSPEKKKEEKKKEEKKVEEKKKKVVQKEESSDEEDDDLTGWY